MNAQPDPTVRRLAAGQALHLGRLGGDLLVVDGDLGDHVIEPGQRIRLDAHENAVIESACTGSALTVCWYPRRQSVAGALAEAPLRGLAFLTALVARGFLALARSAAASASRAQGCIGGGDAMASCGALK